jgi:hypothetical protein
MRALNVYNPDLVLLDVWLWIEAGNYLLVYLFICLETMPF